MRPWFVFREVVIYVAMDFKGVVCDDAEVTWTASQNGIEKFWVRCFGDFFDFAIEVNHPDAPDMISQQTKAASELAVSACLSVSTESYIGTLTERHEDWVIMKELPKLAETLADAGENQRSIAVRSWQLGQNHQILWTF